MYSWVLVLCVFLGIVVFHLRCQIYEHRVAFISVGSVLISFHFAFILVSVCHLYLMVTVARGLSLITIFQRIRFGLHSLMCLHCVSVCNSFVSYFYLLNCCLLWVYFALLFLIWRRSFNYWSEKDLSFLI